MFMRFMRYLTKNAPLLTVLFIIPLLTNIVIGFVFINGRISHIPMAITDLDNSQLSRDLTESFRQCDDFNVKFYPENQNELQRLMDDSSIRCGMVIPKGFSTDVSFGNSPSIMMIYDGSHLSIASAAKSKASELLMTYKAGAELKMLEGNLSMPEDQALKMVQAMKFETRVLYNPAKNFAFFLNPGFAAATAQTAVALIAAACMRREDFTGPVNSALTALKKIALLTICGSISLMLCVVIQSKLFGIPFNGGYSTALLLGALLSLCAASFGTFTSTLITEQGVSMLINAVLFIPCTILSGYTWPVMSMPPIYQTLATYIPFTHFADNIRLLHLKGDAGSNLNYDLAWMIKFSLIFIVLTFSAALIRSMLYSLKNDKARVSADA